jgi:hypothetical protein
LNNAVLQTEAGKMAAFKKHVRRENVVQIAGFVVFDVLGQISLTFRLVSLDAIIFS